MTVKRLFSGARFIGEAEGERRTYYVFQGESGYLVATPQTPRNYSVTLVQNEVPEVISRKFKGTGDGQYVEIETKPIRYVSRLFRSPECTLCLGRLGTREKTQEKTKQ